MCFFLSRCRRIFQCTYMREKFTGEYVQKESCASTSNRIRRHQLRMWESLVNVFVDDIDVVKEKVALRKNRKLPIGTHLHNGKIGLTGANAFVIDGLDFKFASLLIENDAAHVGERAARARVKNHHGVSVAFCDGSICTACAVNCP